MPRYTVTVTAEFQPWNGNEFTVEVTAANKKEAISRARREVARSAHFSREDGRLSYTAELSTEAV